MFATASTLLGRLLIASIFIASALSKIGNHDKTVEHMTAAGMPLAGALIYVAVLVEVACGILVATGFRARLGALLLALFLMPTTYYFHFRPAFDAAMNVVDQGQLLHVMKNLAIMGGLLMIYGNGAGKLTIGKDS